MRRIPTADDRAMQRARISSSDMSQAVIFIEAALALDDAAKNSPEADLARDTARLALEIAAIIFYARPFTMNERPRKTRRLPPRSAPRLGKIDLGPLSKILLLKEARALHRDVLAIRHKVVAHAESRYFPVRMVKSPLPPESGRMGDFALITAQRFPKLDLVRLRSNAKQLGAAFALHTHFAAAEVRKTRRRLRAK